MASEDEHCTAPSYRRVRWAWREKKRGIFLDVWVVLVKELLCSSAGEERGDATASPFNTIPFHREICSLKLKSERKEKENRISLAVGELARTQMSSECLFSLWFQHSDGSPPLGTQ